MSTPTAHSYFLRSRKPLDILQEENNYNNNNTDTVSFLNYNRSNNNKSINTPKSNPFGKNQHPTPNTGKVLTPLPLHQRRRIMTTTTTTTTKTVSYDAGSLGVVEKTKQQQPILEATVSITTPIKMKTPNGVLNYNRGNKNNSTPVAKTPNAGKILSPLPLQSRRLKTPAQKKNVVMIDNMNDLVPSTLNEIVDIDHKHNNGEDDDNSSIGLMVSATKVENKSLRLSNEGKKDRDDVISASIKNSIIIHDVGNNSPSFNVDHDDVNVDKDIDWGNEEEDEDKDDDDDECEPQWTIDDLELVCKLGQGGTASVYQVMDTATEAMYALKIQKNSDDAQCELDLHTLLNHPNICRMIDYFYCDTEPYAENGGDDINERQQTEKKNTNYLCTVLELCSGGSLYDIIDWYGTLPEELAAQYMLSSIDALIYLHEDAQVIHCDIKPGNFLLAMGAARTGMIKVADFGMSVQSEEREIIGGSPAYMSPEHLEAWRDMTDKFDARSDIYSLGVMLYEMLHGYLPFEVIEANDFDSGFDYGDDNSSLSRESLNTVTKNCASENNDDDDERVESIVNKITDLSIAGGSDSDDDDDNFNGFPVLDLRKLNDVTSKKSFYVPKPIFVEEDVSVEAQDLILRLMERSATKRITLQEAKDHEWFQKVFFEGVPV